MFDIEQNHGLKLILDVFERYQWKFQYEKRHEIHEFLENLWEIDNTIKHLKKENPDAVKILHDINPETTDEFLDANCDIMLKVIRLMKEEDQRLAALNKTFSKKHTGTEILREKEDIELEEIPELGYAKRLEKWAKKMKKVVAKAHSKTHEPKFIDMKKRISDLAKDMRWFENSIKEEEKTIQSTAGPVQI